MNKKIETKNATTSSDQNQFEIEVNGVPIVWDLQKGSFTFFGLDAALFWTDPSLVKTFAPLSQELGRDLFRLLVANSSSFGTGEDYHMMVNTLGDTFEDGFLAWGRAVSGAGWGMFELPECDYQRNSATVIVRNPWEMSMQGALAEEDRWGCPFLQGKIIGLFNHAFGVSCWADDHCDYADNHVRFTVYAAEKTISNELVHLRNARMQDRERELSEKVIAQTSELENTRRKLESYSLLLEDKVAERTRQLEEFLVVQKQLNKDLIDSNAALDKANDIRRNLNEKLQDANEQLTALANTDSLTQLPNRHHFDERLSLELGRARREQQSVALLLCDIDNFKNFNDLYGHVEGDECLRKVGKAFAQLFNRASDLPARYGGEEFAVIVTAVRTDDAMKMAEKLRVAVQALNVIHDKNANYGVVTISIGCHVLIPDTDQSVEEHAETMKLRADEALYQAKGNGRNCVMLSASG